MATYEEDLSFEDSKGSPGVIRLIRIGNFYRAYNRSAWMFVSAIADYKVMHKHLKQSNQDLLFVGFPANALFSNIGKRESVKTDRGGGSDF